MKLVLVAIHIEAGPRAVPLGPAMLASALRRGLGAAVETKVLDLFLGQSAEACADRILASDPDAVGFSMYVWNRALALEIATLLKRSRPQLALFAGGPEATADLPGVLGDPSLDFVLPGEGEELIVEALGRLLQGASPAELAAWARPQPVKDLGTLPSPFLDGTLNPADYSGALWELSRGCPFTCDFCFEARGTAGTRRIPMERVEAELELFAKAGLREVFVLDPTFNYHREGAKRVLRLIAERAPEIHFFFEIRSEFLDSEMAELFAAIHCTLQIGLQSAHDDVLRLISRSFNARDFEQKLLLLHRAGVPYGFDLIYGLPGDSLPGFRASLDFAMSLVPNHLDVFRLAVLPGTRLAETAPGLGLQHQSQVPYQVIASPSFPAKDLDQAARLALGCDVLYNQGRAVPWFGLVLEALDMAPSDLFERFADFLDGQDGEDLTAIQRDFILAVFDEQGDSLMGTLAADLITYFGTGAELLDAPEAPARRVSFHHDPVELVAQLQAGGCSLEELVFSVPVQDCDCLLSLRDGEVSLAIVP